MCFHRCFAWVFAQDNSVSYLLLHTEQLLVMAVAVGKYFLRCFLSTVSGKDSNVLAVTSAPPFIISYS